jgi:ammonia channel protein AmtB
VLNTLMMSFGPLIIPVLWMVVTFSLAQVPFENDWLGHLDAADFRDITEAADGGALAIAAYLGTFAVITPALITGPSPTA